MCVSNDLSAYFPSSQRHKTFFFDEENLQKKKKKRALPFSHFAFDIYMSQLDFRSLLLITRRRERDEQ